MSVRNRILRGFPGIALPRYEIDISKRIVEGRTPIWRYGHNLAVAITEETIWEGSSLYVYLTVAERVQVSSSVPATDIPASTGAWTVLVEGLDANYNEISETVTLVNPGPVATTAYFLRVFSARVMTVGTGGKNAGVIIVENNATGNTLTCIPVGRNESHAALWTVPAGKRFIMLEWQGGEVSKKLSHVLLYIRRYGQPFQLKSDIMLNDSHFYIPLDMPGHIEARADIELRATATAGEGIIYGSFSGFYEDVKW